MKKEYKINFPDDINNLFTNENYKQYELTQWFKKELEKSQKFITKDINQVIDSMHLQLNGMSFYSAKILGIRSYYFKNDISTKNKNKI